MCPSCDAFSPRDGIDAVGHAGLGGGRRPRRQARLTVDAVRAARLRLLIERLVISGLGLPGFGGPCAARETLALAAPIRGGATIAFARQVAMYLAHVGCSMSLTEAGALYGRDRTTAAHACSVVENRRDDTAFDRLVGVLEASLRLGLVQVEPGIAERRRTT